MHWSWTWSVDTFKDPSPRWYNIRERLYCRKNHSGQTFCLHLERVFRHTIRTFLKRETQRFRRWFVAYRTDHPGVIPLQWLYGNVPRFQVFWSGTAWVYKSLHLGRSIDLEQNRDSITGFEGQMLVRNRVRIWRSRQCHTDLPSVLEEPEVNGDGANF